MMKITRRVNTVDQIVNTPIRIAYIIGKMWAGGVEAVVFNYYRAIDHTKFQFDFYYDEDSTVEPPNDLIDMGAGFFMLPPYQQLPKYIKTLRSYLRKGNYTIVHSHLNTISVFPLYAAWREHVPVRIAHNHSVPGGNEFKRNVAKNILRRFSKVFATDYFACSEKAGRWMFGDKEFDNGKVYILKNAVDISRYRASEDDSKALKDTLNLNDAFVVGHVGRFTYAKNHLFLLDVFKEILNREKNSFLVLVGDGELHGEILEGIKERGLQKKVKLIGKVSNAEKYYALFDVVLLPSIFEGLSMTTIESQMAGVPVVISKAIPEEAVISDGCMYMEINDTPEAWADAAIKISGTALKYNDRMRDYDINLRVPQLEEEYNVRLRDKCTGLN